MKNNFIIQVAPLVPLPVLRTQIFSYWNEEKLSAGTLVSIPFYFREIQGIVINSSAGDAKQNFMKLKNIRAILEKDFLSSNQIELAKRITDYYFVPLGSVLKLMIPKVVKQRGKNQEICQKKEKGGKPSEPALKILKSDKMKFLFTGTGKEGDKINADLIRALIKKNKQCLILVPEIFFSQSIYEKLRKAFSEEIALIHSRITKGQFFERWGKIKAGKTKIIIATKQGIFLPFSDLGLIVVQEAQDPSFKQSESMPRYNAARGSEYLAEISGAKLVLESLAPPVEILQRAKIGEIVQIREKGGKSLPASATPKSLQAGSFPELEIVSLEREKDNPDFPISKILYTRLAEIVKRKKQAVIFVNRRGFSTRTICENCKKALKCPKCGVALVYSDEQAEYRCLHCAFKMDILSACPSCGGYQFSHRGFGTQTVEKKIKRFFPTARVVRIDGDLLRSVAKYQGIMQKFAKGEVDIIVGTQSVIKGIYADEIELVASISAQDFKDDIEYSSRARGISRIFQMANILNDQGVLMVQSFFGGNPIFKYMENNDLKKYFSQELALRQRFSYPPFRKFVKLACRDKSEKKVEMEAKKAFDLLRATGNNEVEILGPYKPAAGQKRGFFQRNILLKIAPEQNIRNLPIRSVVGALRKGWSVDVDPVSIL